MRFLVVFCVIAALAAPSLGQSAAAPASLTTEEKLKEPEAQIVEEKVNVDATPVPQPAEIPAIEAESTNDNNQGTPNIAEPQIDPTPPPGHEPIVVEVTAPETRPFYSDFIHSIYDRFPFHLPDFHLPSLWPFRGYPRSKYPSRDSYPPVFIVRESEPEYY